VSLHKLKFKEAIEDKSIKLDLGSGKGANTPAGFTPVDIAGGEGITKADLTKRWPWKDESVDEVHCNYLLQFLTPQERIHFANELYRVLKPGAKAVIHTPHWCASKAYGDISIQWPPVAEYWYPMLNKAVRDAQNYTIEGYTCDFECGIGYGLHPLIATKHEERQREMLYFSKEAAQDLICTLTAIK
jgi:SAM-dependent methyltransferase